MRGGIGGVAEGGGGEVEGDFVEGGLVEGEGSLVEGEVVVGGEIATLVASSNHFRTSSSVTVTLSPPCQFL